MFEARFFRRDFWLRGKGRYLLVSLLIGVVLFGFVQVFVPRGDGQQDVVVDRAFWLRLATNAWNYFQPGYGVDANSGLHKAGLYWSYFTDWDLGLYIQAIIDAEKLGIIGKGGSWGADARFEKLLSFLETRELSASRVPYLWYESSSGRRSGDVESNACDSGKLLVALNNLRSYRPEYAARINYVVYSRTNYEPLKQAVDSLRGSVNIYDYYVARGFAAFWPERFSSVADSVVDSIVSAPTVTDVYGTVLPISKLTGETLLHSVFELASNAKLTSLAQRFYLAHEVRCNRTGRFVAFSEGNTDLDSPSYVYEWVVFPSGQTWVLKGPVPEEATLSIPPIVYFKVAVGLLALNNTNFTRSMVSYVESKLPMPSAGYMDGVDENGRVITTIIDKTNGLIISAAEYAVRNLPLPTSTPASSSTVTPTPTPTATATPTSTPSPTSNPSPTATSTPVLTLTPTPVPSVAPTLTPTLSPTSTPSPSPSFTATPTPTASSAPTLNPSASLTPGPTLTMSPTPVSASPSASTPASTVAPSPSVGVDVSGTAVSSPTTAAGGGVLVSVEVAVVVGVVVCLVVSSVLFMRRGRL